MEPELSILYSKAQLEVWKKKRVQEVADKLLGRQNAEEVLPPLAVGAPFKLHHKKGHKRNGRKKGFK